MEEELQGLIYTTLINDVAVSALIAGKVFDRVPKGKAHPYISFGLHTTIEDDADSIVGGEHSVHLDVWSREGGKVQNKRICAAVRDALHEAELSVENNALVYIRVTSVRVLDDADGQTAHGIITVEARMEQS